jgi:GT2 family glycosyltransferase
MGRRRRGQKVGLFPRINLPTCAAPRVSVIIPAASTPELLGACLDSLARFGSRHIPFETIVVLNEASRDFEAGLREAVTGMEVVASPVNLGMAGSGNRGRSLARGEFLVTLHDDAEIEPGWLEALVETADAHPEAGAIGGKAILPDGRLQHAGFILWRDSSSSPPWVGRAPAPTAFDRLRPVDFCGSSSLLVRATAWDTVGGLDERFYPAYYVDTDLCMALRQHRLIVLYQPASRIRHHQSASTTPRFREFLFQHNRQLFLEKWGATLGNQEPRDKNSLAAIERALARAEAFAELCRSEGIVATDPPPKRVPFDLVEQERRHFEMSRALQKAYVAHLTKLVEVAEAGVWWHIYRRCHSLLHRLLPSP